PLVKLTRFPSGVQAGKLSDSMVSVSLLRDPSAILNSQRSPEAMATSREPSGATAISVSLPSRSASFSRRGSPKVRCLELIELKRYRAPVIKAATKPAVKVELAKPAIKAEVKPALKLKAALKTKAALKPVLVKEERIHSHPTMCLHCHLIVEMFHERGADPVKGAWQCPRCGHKYLFSHWKIKRQARGKTEAA